MNESADAPPIQVVVVLYQCAMASSHSVTSFVTILRENRGLAQHFSLLLYDNSPQAQAVGLQCDFAVAYVHDATNGGLARAYNFALARAEKQGAEWLLLLDQDTSVTVEFLSELIATTAAVADRPAIAAIAPKLLVHDEVYSPAASFTYQLRTQFRRREPALSLTAVGVQSRTLYPYNSASALRISALRAVGGFPEEFWLDFLDHAIYHAIFNKGYQLHVLLAGLVHDSSYADMNSLPMWRFRNILRAQALYLKQYGSFVDRLLFRIYLLRHSRNVRQASGDPRMWKETLLQALLLKTGREPSAKTMAP